MRQASSGFTLVELMVVIVLIGVLASMVHISLGDNNAHRHCLQAGFRHLRLGCR